MTYTIGEMAKLLQIPASMLRYYDKEGLLPFVSRSSGGIRIFTEQDYGWLQIIHCLKKTGMPLKDIKEFIHLAMEGDATIEDRLQLFIKQQEAVKIQIRELQETLEVLAFKRWYYETAKAAGATSVPRNMPREEIPQEFRTVRDRLHHLPTANDQPSG